MLMKKILFATFLLSFLFASVHAAYRTAATSGVWTNPSTWIGNQVPVDGDYAIIPAGITVTFTNVGNICEFPTSHNIIVFGRLELGTGSFGLLFKKDITFMIKNGGVVHNGSYNDGTHGISQVGTLLMADDVVNIKFYIENGGKYTVQNPGEHYFTGYYNSDFTPFDFSSFGISPIGSSGLTTSISYKAVWIVQLNVPGDILAGASVVAPEYPPTITSFTPSSGPVGTLVNITGDFLSNPTAVTIGGKPVVVVSNNGLNLVAMVMPGATTGGVSLENTQGSANSIGNFTVTPTLSPTAQSAKLVGTGNVGNARQGVSVAISADGNTAIVGGFQDDSNVGAAWIYTRIGNTWSQQGAKLVGTGSVGTAQQGRAVAISADGNTVLIGGYGDNGNVGAAWVFVRNGNTWSQQGPKIVAVDYNGPASQGFSVALSADGNTAAVGGFSDNSNEGAAWIYKRSLGTWNQAVTKIFGLGNIGPAQQGQSVALSADGNTLLMGGTSDDGGKGAAWIFTSDGLAWDAGTKLVGTGNIGNAKQGQSVALSKDGKTAIVGGYQDNSNQGAAWIYTSTAGVWNQQGAKLVGTGNVGTAYQGLAVSLSADGNTAIVGGYADNSNQGATWAFARNNLTWSQIANKLLGTGNTGAAMQGVAIALSANSSTAIIGGVEDNSGQGAAWIYTADPLIINTGTLTALNTGAGTPSSSTSFNVSGFNMTNSILVTPPTGFEVSLDNTSFNSTVTITGTGNVTATVYVRLSAAATPGSYSGDIVLSSTGATSVNVATVSSTVAGPPQISSFSPSTGAVGSLVTINGTDLGNPTAVTIGGKDAIVISNTGTSLVAMVMPGAVTGGVSITTAGGTGNGTGNFTITTLPPPNRQQGSKILGSGSIGSAALGTAVSISADGNTAIVGGDSDDSGLGAAWIYIRSGGIWTEQAKLVGTGSTGYVQQGVSVAISADGNTVIFGGHSDNSHVGAAWVFVRSNGSWSQQGAKLVGTGSSGDQYQGMSVSLSANGNTAIVGGVDGSSKLPIAWIYTRNGGIWNQQGPKLAAMDYSTSASQGISVSLSADGNTAAIGGEFDDDQGAVWVFTRSGNTWSQQGSKLVDSDPSNSRVGHSISISADGNTIITGDTDDSGSQGAAWIFTRNASIWSQQGNKLVGTGGITGFRQYQGSSVSISADGNTAIIGGYGESNPFGPPDLSEKGAVWIFSRTANIWSQVGQKLVGTGNIRPSDQGYASAISADGNTIFVGGRADDSSQGAAWVYTYVAPPTITSFIATSGPIGTLVTITGTDFDNPTAVTIGGTAAIVISNTATELVAMVMPGAATGAVSVTTASGTGNSASNFTVTLAQAPTGQQGDKLVGTGDVNGGYQGRAVALSADGNTAVVGSEYDNGTKGAIWIFTRSGDTWTQQGAKLAGTGSVGGSRMGTSVAISADGNTVIAGAPYENTFNGAVWVFTRNGNTWSQQGNKLFGTGIAGESRQGTAVALSADGNTAIIGGERDDNAIGASWIFTRSNGTWTQQGSKLVGSDATSGAFQGISVALSADGNTALVGGAGDNSNKGAAWAYTRNAGVWTQQGAKMIGTGVTGSGRQGYAVGLNADGNTAIIGGTADNSNKGAVWFFTRSAGAWSQQGSKLTGTGAVGNAQLGSAVSLSADGNIAIVGGYSDNDARGAAWMYTRTNGAWIQQGSKLLAANHPERASFGMTVALSANGTTALVGGPSANKGAAWAYSYYPAPSISSFTPALGAPGTLVNITGTNLANTTGVTIGGTPVLILSNTATSLVAMVAPGTPTGLISVTAASATANGTGTFTVTETPFPNLQQGNKLVGSGAIGAAWQGRVIAISADGNTAVVGGHEDNSQQGAAWIYTRSGTAWTEQAKLVGTGNTGAAAQGLSVALSADGNTMAMGGANDNANIGAVWIFTRNGVTWAQQGNKLTPSNALGSAYMGSSVSLSANGNTLLTGGYGDNADRGAMWIFTRTGNTWTQLDKLSGYGNTGSAQQGRSVALSGDGNTAIVGGYGDNSEVGAAWIFTRNINNWSQEGKLVGSGNVGAARQGISVSISFNGNTVIIGADRDNANEGAAWVFTRSGGSWTQEGTKLKGTDHTGLASQGNSVSLSADGNTAFIGGYSDNNNQGAAWTFTRNNTTWTQRGNKIVGIGSTGSSVFQGASVSISADGATGLIGGLGDDSSKGAVWAFIPATPATVANAAASAIVATGVVLNGTVNGNGAPTAVSFDYGTATDLSGATTTTATTGGSLGAGAGNSQVALTLSGLTSGTTYYFRVRATNLGGTILGTPILSFTTPKIDQTISFSALSAKTYGDANFSLTATGGASGNTVTYASSNTAVATVSGSTVTIVGAGTTTITASQAGNANYSAATDVQQNLTVGKASQTISFSALSAKTYGDANFNLTATGGASGNTVTYASSNTAVATVSGSTVTIVGAGTTTITASQAGNANYSAATDVQQSLTVGKAGQTISFSALSANTYGDANFNLTATGGASGNAVTFTSSNTAVATVSGNTVTIVGAGATNITASQAGNANYSAATDVQQNLTVGKASQIISFSALSAKTYGDANFNLTATGGASANAVTYASSNTAVATVAGSTVTIVGAGTTNITASQAGNTNYSAATDVQQNLTIGKASQTISFSALAAKTYGDANFSLTATGGASGNAVTYASSNTAVATVSGSTVTIVGAGTTNITASQAGNVNYNAAANVQQSLTVGKANQTISFNALSAKTYGDANFNLTATGGASGIAVTFTSSNTAVATVSGNTVTIVGAGTTTLTASQAGNANYNAAADASQTLTVTQKQLTASFTASNKNYDGNVTATITSRSLTGVLTADQANVSLIGGSATFTTAAVGTGKTIAATGMTLSGTLASNYILYAITGATADINPKPITVTADTKTKTYGDADPALTYAIPVGSLVGSDAVTGSLARSAGNGAGTYPIQIGTLTAGSNYTINYTGANLTIDKKVMTITADNKNRLFNLANPTLSVSYSGFVGIEDITSLSTLPTITTTAIGTSPVGSYPITASGAVANNYSFNYVTGTLTIAASSQAITFAALADKLSTDAPFTLNASANSGLTISYASSDVTIARIINGNQVEILKAGTVTITASQAGNANYTAAISVAQALKINDNPAPVITITSNLGLSISKGETAKLTATGAITYVWSNAEGIISGQNTAVLTIRPFVNTTYTVTGTNQYGRTSTQTIAITVRPDFQAVTVKVSATNIVSPNGDGVNDVFVIDNIDAYPNSTVKIIDRTGKILYSTVNYKNDWDGKFRGHPLVEGTYYYIIDFGDGKTNSKKGYITVVKD
jgi:gliding motility-associated-like protein